MATALNGSSVYDNQGSFIKPGPNARWRPVPGQDLQLPYSSGSYQIEYVLPTNPDRLDAWTLMYYFPAYQDIDMHYTIQLTYHRGLQN